MSKLREAAQAALNQWDKVSGVFRMTAETEALRAALAQPETAEPVAWQTFDGEGGYDYRDFYQNEDYELEWKRLNPAYADWVTPLYAHPPRDEWRPASDPPENGRDVVVWMNDGGHGCFASGHCVRGEWTPNYVGSPVTHWRDVQPPTEGAK